MAPCTRLRQLIATVTQLIVSDVAAIGRIFPVGAKQMRLVRRERHSREQDYKHFNRSIRPLPFNQRVTCRVVASVLAVATVKPLLI